MIKRYSIIVAGGVGNRSGRNIPKQLVELSGSPMIFHTIRAFVEYDRDMQIIVVMNEDWIDDFEKLCRIQKIDFPFSIVAGGKCRADSVKNGLDFIDSNENCDCSEVIVSIHDAARPLVSKEVIAGGFNSVEKGIGAVPVVSSVNSLRRLLNPKSGMPDNLSSVSVNRNDFVEVQTPQVFYFNDIYSAYNNFDDLSGFTDDASVAETAGMKIRLYEGSRQNIKVTNPLDFDIAEVIMKNLAENV